MRALWYGPIFVIIGMLLTFSVAYFGLYISNWVWWVITLPLSVLFSVYICWRDEKIRKETLETLNNGK